MIQAPQALRPGYRTPRVNEEVRLYYGPIQLAGGGQVHTLNDAEVVLSWLPVPRLLVLVHGRLRVRKV